VNVPPYSPHKRPKEITDCRVSYDPSEFLAAEANEKLVRNAAHLSLTETIGGFECEQITLEKLLLFQFSDNDIFTSTPTLLGFAQFVWILSPRYNRKGGFWKWWTYKSCERKFLMRREPKSKALIRMWIEDCARRTFRLQIAIAEARKFIDETFQDSAGGSGSGVKEIDYYSDATWICATLAREHGDSKSETMTRPLKLIFQDLKEIRHWHLGRKAGLTNRSSELLHQN